MARELKQGSILRWPGQEEGEGTVFGGLMADELGRDHLRGEFVELKVVNTKFGDGHILVIDVSPPFVEKSERQYWSCPTRLKMACERIRAIGQSLAIFPLGTIKMKNGTALDFKVFELDTMTEEVGDFEA